MKKLLFSILLTFLPLLTSAEIVEIDGIWYDLVTKAQKAEVTRNPSGEKYSGDVDIPASVTYNDIKYCVTTIGEWAFANCSDLTSITIPNSVTRIESNAFEGSTGLNSVSIPNSVTSIGFEAFYGCGGLNSVHIKDLKAWCEIGFADDSNPLYYAQHLYLNGEEVEDLVIPSNVTSIGRKAFSHCKLKSIIIPNSVTSIGESSFSHCQDLTSVIIYNGLTSISSYAFFNCSALNSIVIPNSVTSIDDHAFYSCIALTSITIPNSVTNIGSQAFRECSALSSITLPNNLTSISNDTFYGCSALTSVTIGSGVKTIGDQAFAKCKELSNVYCLADKVSKDYSWNQEGLYTNPSAFSDSYPQYMTLHVPAASIEAYRSTVPWSNFKAIVPLEDDDIPEIEKCATPEISYENGIVKFTCETEEVEFISEVTVSDAKKYYDSEFTLSQTYKITVYATKAGYENSDVATREIVVEKEQTSLFGDLDKDGKVNVADHVKLSEIILNK